MYIPADGAIAIDYIIADIDKAVSLLPEKIKSSSTDYGRVDQCFAKAFKAKVLLYKASPQFNPSNQYGNKYWSDAYTAAKDAYDFCLSHVGAAEKWDGVVAYAVARGWSGVENLSFIPGEVGAAAVQNIGAYGTEVKDVIETVEAFNQLSFEKKIFSNQECCYSYRSSFFKNENNDPHIVTYVNIRLRKHFQFNLSYKELQKELLPFDNPDLQAVRDAVILLRRRKLPDPEMLGNAGSFFMNPVITVAHFESLKDKYPNIPFYTVDDGQVKLSAGWLIEQCGFKGKSHGSVGVYEKQALVLVNLGNATGDEIAMVAESIRMAVNDRFGIMLMPEVKYVS